MQPDSPYHYFSKIAFRVPHFPVEYLYNRKTVNSPLFREALYLASPDLYQGMSTLQDSDFDTFPLNIQLSILKYLIRMSTRCTPFGLFAGCGIGEIDHETDIKISGFDNYQSTTRFDMNFLGALCQKLNSLNELKEQISYFSNNSMYKSADEYRYIEYQYENGRRKYFLTSVDDNPYLERIFGLLGTNGKTVKELASEIVDEENSVEDATEFLNLLIGNQILTSELEPTVIGEDVLDQIICSLKEMNGDRSLYNFLLSLKGSLSGIDSKSIGRDISDYLEIENKIKAFDIAYDRKFLFQTDLLVTTPVATLNSEVADAAVKCLKVINKLSPYHENQVLKQFKEEFYKRYENEEIPLVEALDTDIGIGFYNISQGGGDINPLIDDINLNTEKEASNANANEVELFLLGKYVACKNDGKDEVLLIDDDLTRFPDTWDNLPPTVSSIIEVLEYDDANNFLIRMNAAGGSSAANLLGRFCHINSGIEDLVSEVIKKDEQILGEDKLIAEIVHLPESRTGNILYRPRLRTYEIPFLARHSVASDFIIPIDDLMVSCKYGRDLVLRSKRFGKQVVTRLTNAHNFTANSLPIYHFLALFQYNNMRSAISFNWGNLLKGREFLPRVRYENIILSPAIWNISSSETTNFPRAESDEFFDFARNFKKDRHIPDQVFLVQGDNKLFIDFNDALSVKLLFSEMKNKSVQLEENLFKSEKALVKGLDGNYTNQLILNFYKKQS